MSTPHTIHEWRERADDGEHRYYRAWRGLGEWHFLTTLRSEPEWHPLTDPDLEFMRSLREKLFAKYQRRRVPWEQIEEIDKMIASMEPEEEENKPAKDGEGDDEDEY